MKISSDPHIRRDLLKLVFVLAAIVGTTAVFFVTPSLSTPTMLSLVTTLLMSPLVAALERRGYPRTASILILFTGLALISATAGIVALRIGEGEWDTFKVKAPQYFDMVMVRLHTFEDALRTKYSLLANVKITETLVAYGHQTGQWFATNGANLMGELLSCLFIAPILTFFLLNDGPAIRKRFFQLIPNRFFESAYMISHDIATAISDYARAKLIEAFLVGLMTTVGLWCVGAPYAIVLGILAGVTNIVPYAGPIVGAAPGLLAIGLDPAQAHLLWPVVFVYIGANLVDMVFIFPVIVAKLVDLHPLLLLAAVAVGQQYYGLIGMLISIPVAAAFKVVLQEIYSAVYEKNSATKMPAGKPHLSVVSTPTRSYSDG